MDDERKKKIEEKRKALEPEIAAHRRLVDDVLNGREVLCSTCGKPLKFTGSTIICGNGCTDIHFTIHQSPDRKQP
jgi:hypothetical protein